MYIHDFLRSRGVWFEGLLYQPASSSARRARNARIAGRRVAKAVLVRAGDSLLLAVLPASCRIDLDRLGQVLGSSAAEIRLATAEELLATFSDCEPGVVPPFGRLYGLPTLVDSALFREQRHRGQRQHAARGSVDAFPRLRGDRRARAGILQPADLAGPRPVRRPATARNAGAWARVEWLPVRVATACDSLTRRVSRMAAGRGSRASTPLRPVRKKTPR